MSPCERSVFINVPFDGNYQKLLDAIVYAVHDCGLKTRTALEEDDGGDVRILKIYRIIDQCRYGIHDLSRTTLDTVNRLPRFNMPLELGVFLGARQFGSGRHKRKSVLILDRDKYRYQKFCSDISGQDNGIGRNTIKRIFLDNGLEPAPARGKKPSWETFPKSHWGRGRRHGLFQRRGADPEGVDTLPRAVRHRPEDPDGRDRGHRAAARRRLDEADRPEPDRCR